MNRDPASTSSYSPHQLQQQQQRSPTSNNNRSSNINNNNSASMGMMMTVSLAQPGSNYSRAGRFTTTTSTMKGAELNTDNLPTNSSVRLALQRHTATANTNSICTPGFSTATQQLSASKGKGKAGGGGGTNSSLLLFGGEGGADSPSSLATPTPLLSAMDIATYNQNRGNSETVTTTLEANKHHNTATSGGKGKGGKGGNNNSNNNSSSVRNQNNSSKTGTENIRATSATSTTVAAPVVMVPLDINSLGVNGSAGISPTPLHEAIVTSSPRLHPSVHHQQRHQFVAGKQSLFAGSLQSMLRRPVLPNDDIVILAGIEEGDGNINADTAVVSGCGSEVVVEDVVGSSHVRSPLLTPKGVGGSGSGGERTVVSLTTSPRATATIAGTAKQHQTTTGTIIAVAAPVAAKVVVADSSSRVTSPQRRQKSAGRKGAVVGPAFCGGGGTSAFLSPTRESVTKSPALHYPPVGHYHPQYTAVELPISKPAVFPKSILASHHTVTTNAAAAMREMSNNGSNSRPNTKQQQKQNSNNNNNNSLRSTTVMGGGGGGSVAERTLSSPAGGGGVGGAATTFQLDGTMSLQSYSINNNYNVSVNRLSPIRQGTTTTTKSSSSPTSTRMNGMTMMMDSSVVAAGSINTNGNATMSGNHNNNNTTTAMFGDGFTHGGDLGAVDELLPKKASAVAEPTGSTLVAFGRGKSVNGRRDEAPPLSPEEDRAETERVMRKEMERWLPVSPYEKVIVTSTMSRETGRKWDENRSISANLVYDQRVPDCTTSSTMFAVPSFHKRTGRDAPTCGRAASVGPAWGAGTKPVRTAAQIESYQPSISLDAYCDNRYKRDPCITFISKQPSREVAINNHITTRLAQSMASSELPSNLDGRYSSSGMYGGVDMFDVSASSRSKQQQQQQRKDSGGNSSGGGHFSAPESYVDGAPPSKRLIGDVYHNRGGQVLATIKKVPAFATMQGRKPQPLLPGQGLVYDLSYAAQDTHVPDTKLPPRVVSSSGGGTSQPYSTTSSHQTHVAPSLPNSLDTAPIVNVDVTHKRIIQDVSFTTNVSREQRDRVGRNATVVGGSGGASTTTSGGGGVDSTATTMSSSSPPAIPLDQLAIPVTLRTPLKGAVEFSKGTNRMTQNRTGHFGTSPQTPSSYQGGGGSPFGGGQKSRYKGSINDESGGSSSSKALRLGSGGGMTAVGSNDLVYTYNVDKFKQPLTKGAVEFGKMTSRDTHKAAVHDRPSLRRE